MTDALILAGYALVGVVTGVLIFRDIAKTEGVDATVYGGAICLGILWPGTLFVALLFWSVEREKKGGDASQT